MATDFSTEVQKPKKRNIATPIVKPKPRKLLAFGWYGGKFSHLSWLLPLLPPCHHYCEPFGGSAAVLLNREPSPIETYNDIDGEVVNFFRVLRDEPERLIRALALTPYSREEFALALAYEIDPDLDPIERARRFFVRARQVHSGKAQTASLGNWGYAKNSVVSGMSKRVAGWLHSIEHLPEVALRLLRVQIENRPAVEVIQLYDSPTTLFYCDPPYPHEARVSTDAYGYEMSDEDHCQLAEVLNSVQALVAISGYECDLMNSLYPSSRWLKITGPAKPIASSPTKRRQREVLWTNYDPAKYQPQQRLI